MSGRIATIRRGALAIVAVGLFFWFSLGFDAAVFSVRRLEPARPWPCRYQSSFLFVVPLRFAML